MAGASTVSPVDGGPLDSVLLNRPDELEAIVSRARKAQQAWVDRSLEARIRALMPVRDRILDRAEAIARAVHREVGKPEVEVLLGEVLPSADVAEYWTRNIEELLEPLEIELDRMTYPGKGGVIERTARGVIALIQPWNFPVALPLRTIVPALLAGNAVVFKPSEVSPRAGAIIGELFAGLLPDGLLAVVQGGGDLGASLCQADVDLVVFTGSVATGRRVAHACADKLIPCSLELGGKDAAIVLADADLERAANGVVWGAMTNAGQNCAAIERVYVEKGIADAFVRRLESVLTALRPGVDVGPLATETQRSIVSRHVEEARAGGAQILHGGTHGDQGYAYAPTLVRVGSDEVALMREETFGPVLPVAVVESAEEAVTRANASRYGLTASVWTRSRKRAEVLSRQLRAGVVTINNHAFTGAIPSAPWSGQGETGWGITNSPFALEALTRPRFVLLDRSRSKRELWWFPYTPALRSIALSMAALRSRTTSIVGRVRAVFELLGGMLRRWKT
jgi:acyl-CoA reductase-like NAD-dependent aldehyde dehydrogenase